jgi:hypothetical protein
VSRARLVPACGGVVRDSFVPGDQRGQNTIPLQTSTFLATKWKLSHTLGPRSPSGGFWAQSTLNPALPNEAEMCGP